MFRKPPHLSERLPGILGRLGRMAEGFDPQQSSATMLADAYQWFYRSGKHTYDADGRFNFENNLESYELLDALLDEDSEAIFEANDALQAKHAPRKGQLSGFRRQDSNICISPNFAESFKLVPAIFRQGVVEKLKEFAKLTSDHQSDRQKEVRSKATSTKGLITLPVGPGISLCIEFEAVSTVAFLGFLVPGTYRTTAGGSVPVNRGGAWLNALPKAAFAMSLVILIVAMLYVPYDVILTGRGPTMRVFSGYDFVWTDHVLNNTCRWYINEKLHGQSVAAKNCYTALALPRVAMTVGAAFVLMFGSLVWMKGASRN